VRVPPSKAAQAGVSVDEGECLPTWVDIDSNSHDKVGGTGSNKSHETMSSPS
jgi:hypothetical protein